MLVVRDMQASVEFYQKVLGLEVILDFGTNKTLTGGLSLQTLETYSDFIHKDISFGGNASEIYFEEDDFDAFLKRIGTMSRFRTTQIPFSIQTLIQKTE